MGKRLLQITRTLPWQIPGGMEAHAWELSRALRERGWDVEIVTSALDDHQRIETREGIRIHYVAYLPEPRPQAQWRWWLRFAPAVRRYVEAIRLEFDAAHSESVYGHELFRALPAPRVPCVMTLHGTHVLQYRESGRPDMLRRHKWYHPRAIAQALFVAMERRQDRKRVLPSADGLVAVSGHIASHVARDYGQPKGRIEVIPNGIRHPSTPAPRPPRPSGKARKILYLGRLARSKGIERLLAHARSNSQDHLTIAGDGEDAARLRNLAADLIESGRVRFLGHVDEETKWRLFRESDVFALPSDSEGQPISIVEALAAGTPVYARGDWAPEALRHLVVVGTDVEAGIAQAASMTAEVQEAAPSIRKEFSWGQVAARYEDLYRRLAAR